MCSIGLVLLGMSLVINLGVDLAMPLQLGHLCKGKFLCSLQEAPLSNYVLSIFNFS